VERYINGRGRLYSAPGPTVNCRTALRVCMSWWSF
jgi:hypothetical protein